MERTQLMLAKVRKVKAKKTKKSRRGPKKGTGILKPMKVDAVLADIIGKKKAARGQCIKGLWAYIKKNKLQDPTNGRFFTPDAKMAKIFGSKKMNGFLMGKFLSAHLSD